MSENTENPTEETPTEDPGQTPAESQGTGDGGTDDQGAGTDGGADADQLDAEQLRTQLKDARAEAAKSRVKNRELREQLAKAKTPEDFQAVADKAAQLEVELATERAARKYSLPAELVEYLKGSTAEELEESAKKLAKFAGPAAGLGSGGLDPSKSSAPASPAELAASIPRARR